MKNQPSRLRIDRSIFRGHVATPKQWDAAKPNIERGHRTKPTDPFVLLVPGPKPYKVEVRTDEEGNLYLEHQD